EAKSFKLSTRDIARLAWFRQILSGSVWFESGAARTFVTIAEQLRDGGDAYMALRSLVPIAHRCWWTRTKTRTREYLVEAALAMGMADDDPRVLAVVGLAHPEETGPTILKQVSRMRLHEMTDPIAAMYVGIAAEKAGDFATGVRFLASAIGGLREQVRLVPLTQALVHYAWAATHAGEWPAAAAAAHEAAGLARDTRQPQYGLTAELVGALATALRGTEPDIESVLAEPERALLAMKGGPLLATAPLGQDMAGNAMRRARTVFSLGPCLRPRRRSDEPPSPLRESEALFDALGAAAGSRRARQERRATGEKVGRGAPDLRDRLTAQ